MESTVAADLVHFPAKAVTRIDVGPAPSILPFSSGTGLGPISGEIGQPSRSSKSQRRHQHSASDSPGRSHPHRPRQS